MNIKKKDHSVMTTIDLENLGLEYKETLKKYKIYEKTYIEEVNNLLNHKHHNRMSTLSNTSYYGSPLSSYTNSSIDKCKSECSKNSKCKGATFINSSNSCNLYSSGEILASRNKIAIIPEIELTAKKLKRSREKLDRLIEIILSLTNEHKPIFNRLLHKTYLNNKKILEFKDRLAKETNKIDTLEKELKEIDSQHNFDVRNITSYYYSYTLLYGVALVSVAIIILINTNNK